MHIKMSGGLKRLPNIWYEMKIDLRQCCTVLYSDGDMRFSTETGDILPSLHEN